MYENGSAADTYDLVYQDRKNYQAEAVGVAQLVRARKPDASTLLDVACGTGSHLQAYAKLFDRVEGLDLADAMVAVAAQRLPGVPLHLGDMRDFRLNRSFDAIVCMFSSIGYLRSTADLDQTLSTMAHHLAPGGVVVIEPWYFPDTFLDGHVSGHVVTKDGHTVARVSHSSRKGDVTRMEIHYVVADAVSGIHHRSEIDMLTLFTRDQYETAFTRAGCKSEYIDAAGPGFFVGVA